MWGQGLWSGPAAGSGGVAWEQPRCRRHGSPGGLQGDPGGYCHAKAKRKPHRTGEEQEKTNLKRFFSLVVSVLRMGRTAWLPLQSCRSEGALHGTAFRLSDIRPVLLPAFSYVTVS